MGSGRKGVADLRFLSSPPPSLTTLEVPKLKARKLHSRPGTRTLDQVPSLRAQATSLWDQAPSFWNQAPSLWERTISFWDQAISLWGQDTSFWDEAPSLWETGTRHSHSGTRHPHSGTRVSGVSFKSASLFTLKNAELRLCQKNSAFLKPNFAFSISVPFLQTRPKLVRKHLRGFPYIQCASQNP